MSGAAEQGTRPRPSANPAAVRAVSVQTAAVLTVAADRVAAAISRHWPVVPVRLEGLAPGATSQVWLVHADGHRFVAKLCFDTQAAFDSGLVAADHVQRSTGIATGAPVRSADDDLSVLIPTFPGQAHPLALLTHVAGTAVELGAIEAADLLCAVHQALRSLPAMVGHDPLLYLTDSSVDYAYRETIQPALRAMVTDLRAADLIWGTCYGDGPETVRQATGEVALLDWGGVLAGPILWDVAEWKQSRDSDFREAFLARLIDVGFVRDSEMALLPLVSRVRAARELRFRAHRLLRSDHYGTADTDGPRIAELAAELGIHLKDT
jgi:hypothetical protein